MGRLTYYAGFPDSKPKHESCSYSESMADFDICQYTLPHYDRWYPLKHMRQSHYKQNKGNYIFRRPIERQLSLVQA